ncbi:MAG: FAD-binding protein, partial [Acidimicrobiia bacterium]
MTTTPSTTFDLPGFKGRLIHPGDADYDEARKVFNGMIDRSPVLIARGANADDVAAAVGLARDQNLPLSVYGGGHGVTGSAVCDAGVCI